jgi:hypothetical protein
MVTSTPSDVLILTRTLMPRLQRQPFRFTLSQNRYLTPIGFIVNLVGKFSMHCVDACCADVCHLNTLTDVKPTACLHGHSQSVLPVPLIYVT